MKLDCYLVVQGKRTQFGVGRDSRRDPGTIRVAKRKPACARDEVAIKLSLDIPDSLFIQPTLEASITVPGPAGPVITAEVQERISEIVQQQTGLTLRIDAAQQEQSDER